MSLTGLIYINKDVDISLSSRKMFTPAKRSRASKPVAPTKVPRTVGDGARIGKSRFASLSLSDSEDEQVSRPVVPVTIADCLLDEAVSWGDEYGGSARCARPPAPIVYVYAVAPAVAAEVEEEVKVEEEVEVEEEKDWADAEADLWAQPFAASLSVKNENIDLYDCRLMSDQDYAAFMTYLYAHGWIVSHEERRWVQAGTGYEPPRVWVPPSTASCCGSGGKKEKTVVPRFCREGEECCTQDCRYVHGDYIPKVDRACAFGERCGSSDPTGEKRALCIYIHPGEVWTAESCVCRHR